MLTIISAICLWLAATTGGALFLLPYDKSNAIVVSLLFFNNLNILIAICEIALGVHIQFIQKDYRRMKEEFRGREMDAVLEYLLLPLPNPFDLQAWSRMWSTYALYDPSYQNQESFGFFIDVGNGFTTIPPCLLWNYAMAYPSSISPLLVGVVGIASYWQVFYGTVIYFLSFFFNKRYRGRSWVEVAGFVGFTNSIWFFFPIIAIYAAVCILRDKNLSVFQ